jgi:molybdate transport system ATP-binding protein
LYTPPERRGVGYAPQDDLLFPHLSVKGNLRFGMRYTSAHGPDFDHVVKILGLAELLDRDPSTLSGGQRQRVALGRAVLRGPRVLLMDEPVSALDEALKHRMVPDLRRLVDDLQLTALVVCHDQSDIRRFADQVVLLEAGRVVGAGPAGPTLDAVFKARGAELFTPTNLVCVTGVREDNGQWVGSLGGNRVALPAPTDGYSDTMHIAFDPSDVTLSHEDVPGVSIRNHWRGRVLDLAPVGGRVFVRLDVGQPLWAEITPQAQRSLGVQAGESVVCLVKTTALRPLPVT